MRQGAREGVFAEEEEDMVVNVFRLDDVRVDAIMTPRTEIDWLDLEDPIDENFRKITTTEHSYFPVCREDLDRVVGVLKAKALLNQLLYKKDEKIELETFLLKPLFLPDVLSLSSVLKAFKRSGKHMALVISEHGGIEGMVTINDIMEEIVGDVDQEGPQVVTRQDQSLLVDGMLSVHRLRDLLQVESLPGDEEVDYQTLGGFVMDYLGKVPHAADSFEWAGLRFEVMDMDGNRVDKVLIQKLETDSNASQSAESE
jgi:putative hemolysin